MNKTAKLCICILLAALLSACAGPGTGPYGRYTEADRQRDQANTVLAVGAAAVIGTSLYRAGRRDGRREAYRSVPVRRAPPQRFRAR